MCLNTMVEQTETELKDTETKLKNAKDENFQFKQVINNKDEQLI